jgi:regulator of PEP synthase PpsR (kinase-PPPase family)
MGSPSHASKPLSIFVLSGGTGRTGDQIVEAALAQFARPAVQLERRTNVRTIEAARGVIQEAEGRQGIVFHTLVAPDVRQAVADEAARRMVPLVDILGPALAVLEDHLRAQPRRQAGLSYLAQKDRFDRMDAVDYTLHHDDGQRPEGLLLADVVLVGPSRVSKSVTCFYLAYRGVRAANVPLVLGVAPPPQLGQLDPEKVIGLTMNPHRLRAIRETRTGHFGADAQTALDEYSEPKQIAQELRYALSLTEQRHWRHIDVSYKSVEETAEEVLRMLGNCGNANRVQ